jgi:HK97 family phage prohead protease
MPWDVKQDDRCPASKPWGVVKADGELEGCHETEDAAKKQQAALYANEEKSMPMPEARQPDRPPRDGVRAVYPGVELRAAEDGGLGVMAGHFAVFDQWTEINSTWEGHFMERLAPGSFAKAIKDKADRIRVLFQHGQDPQIGDKPLGAPSVLREEETGPYYEVPLIDTSYNRDLLPGLRAGLYGASFRFQSVKEDFERDTKAAPHNPDALPERTIREVELFEFGPVTFPAYAGATAGVRSMTDDYFVDLLMADPERARALLTACTVTALPDDGAEAKPHSDGGSRQAAAPPIRRFQSREEYLEWLTSNSISSAP